MQAIQQAQLDAAWQVFSAAINDDLLHEAFPIGLRTPEAIIARAVGEGVDINDLAAVVTAIRSDPDYAANRGHKRAAAFAILIALMHVAVERGFRQATQRMRETMTQVLPINDAKKVVYLRSLAFDTNLTYEKTGIRQVIQVPAIVATNAEVVRWSRIVWPPLLRR